MPGLSIDIAANTRPFQASVDDAADSLDHVADALDDAARDGDRATERLEASFRDLSRAAEREAQKIGDDFDRNATRGVTRAQESMREVKSEALQNASETFSSFDGSVSSFVGGIQGTFGGLIAGLAQVAPQFLPIAIAGAAGIGLISTALGESEQRAEEFRQKVSDLTTQFIESNNGGQRTADQYVEALRQLATEADRDKANLADMDLATQHLGVSLEEVTRAYIAGGPPLDDLIAKTRELVDEEKGRTQQRAGGRRAEEALQADALNNLEDELRLYEEQRDAIARAQEAQLQYLQTGVSEFEAKVGLIEAVNDAYDNAASATEGFIDKETGVFNVDAFLASFAAREQALLDYQNALASSGLTNEAKDFLNKQGADAAASFLSGYQAASPEQKRELNRIWTEAGKENSGSYLTELDAGISGATVGAPEVALDPAKDAAAYIRDFQRILNRTPLTVSVEAVNRPGQLVP